MKFVIVHDSRGVYLAPDLYSKDAAPKPNFAPTYPEGIIEETNAHLEEVTPDLAGGHASKKACEFAGVDTEGW